MVSFSLPFRDAGGTSFKLGKLAAAPPRDVQEPNGRVPLNPVGEAVPLEDDKKRDTVGCMGRTVGPGSMQQKLGWRCLWPRLGLGLALIGLCEQELDP
jgi:hypothetical protein